jgi:hypothetical protein
VAAGDNRLQKVLRAGIEALENDGVRYCLVGGLARAYLADPRGTKDIDFAVSVDSDLEAEQLIFRLQGRRFVLRELFQKKDGRVATARLTYGEIPVRLDLLFLTSGIEAIAVAESARAEILPGLRGSVIRRPHLIVMKLVAARPQDLIDIEALLDAGSVREQREVRRILSADSRAAVLLARWEEILRRRAARADDLMPASRARVSRLLRGQKKPR